MPTKEQKLTLTVTLVIFFFLLSYPYVVKSGYLVSVVESVDGGISYLLSEESGAQANNLLEIEGPQIPTPDLTPESFININLEAQSAYVFDLSSEQIIYSKNADQPLPLASLTKLMTALLAYELPSPGVITVRARDLKTEGESGLVVGEKWYLKNLIDFMLVKSSNDAAVSISSAVGSFTGSDFVVQMNKRAGELGLSTTRFSNSTGLDESPNVAGAYGSARDVSTLMGYIYKRYPNLLEATRYDKITLLSLDRPHLVHNSNISASYTPLIVASKTGFTDLAGGNLAVIFEAGPTHPFIVVVLGSTYEGRFKDVDKLVSATITSLK